ncbi:MAG: hypothetical protein IPH45_19130 [Bacteroidales bacterium]|nr:hypothetical protein [Bacteroidales bacterium]
MSGHGKQETDLSTIFLLQWFQMAIYWQLFSNTSSCTIQSTPTLTTLPSTFSWESKCTPVKDQGQCGSCWAFAGVATLEANINIRDNAIKDLSEQWLINCATEYNGCQGGFCPHNHFLTPGVVYEGQEIYEDYYCFQNYGNTATCIGSCNSSGYIYNEILIALHGKSF